MPLSQTAYIARSYSTAVCKSWVANHNEESFLPAPHEPDPDATSDNIPTPQARRFPCLLIPR